MKNNNLLNLLAIILLSLATSLICNAQKGFLGGHFNVALPIGTFSDDAKAGIGGGADLSFFVGRNTALGATFNYNSFGAKNTGNPGVSLSFNITQIEGSVRQFLSDESFKPYSGLSLGASILSISASQGSQSSSISAGTAFHLSPTIGFMYEITQRVAIDANIRYNVVFSKNTQIDNSSISWGYNIGNIPISLGLVYLFGK